MFSITMAKKRNCVNSPQVYHVTTLSLEGDLEEVLGELQPARAFLGHFNCLSLQFRSSRQNTR
jgi:hypothetical protein